MEKQKPAQITLDQCVSPWRTYREDLITQKTNLEKDVDKTVFTISSGAIGISLVVLDKITLPTSFWYLYFILAVAWIFLVISLIFQTFSFIHTAKKIKDSIEKVGEIVSSGTIEGVRQKEDEYYDFWETENSTIDKKNKKSLRCMISGIASLLLFAFVGLMVREPKQIQPINIILSDSLTSKFNNMSKAKGGSGSSKDSVSKPQNQGSSKQGGRSSQRDSNKNAQQIKTPPVKTPKKSS